MPERGLVIAVGAGVAAVRSDICGSGNCNDFGPNVSIGAVYKLNPFWGISAGVGYARLGAEEKDPARPLNISFQSEVVEVTASVMFNLLDSYAGSGYRSSRKRFVVPYLKAGGGFIYYTPTSFPGQGKLDDSQTTYDPQRNYPAIAAVIPLGAGLRFRLNDEISIAPELTYSLTTTDYLDNIVPPVGSTEATDHYATATVKLLYTPVLKNKILTRKY